MNILPGGLRRSFVVSGAAMTLLLALVGSIGIWAATSLGDAIRAGDTAARALRNHMTADMMHDALRADVLSAIESGTRQMDQGSTLSDLEKHVAALRESVAENRALPLPEAIASALREIGGPLDVYVSRAEKLAPLGLENPALARREVASFLAAFRALEEKMAQAGDLIEKDASDRAAASVELSGQAVWAMTAALLFGALAALMSSFLLGRSVAPPIEAMTQAMKRLADGDLTVEIPSSGRRDEIGAMAGAVRVFKRNAEEMRRMEDMESGRKAEAEERRRAEMKVVADRFEVEVLSVAASVSASAEQLRQNAETMRAAAGTSDEGSTAVAAAAEETTVNMRSVAGAASQLSASIHEIAHQVAAAAGATSNASGQTRASVDIVNRLAAAVARIGQAVTLIGEVSAQTNLLALNATIEAARAGEAGRGFAIVASEVKQLAEQSARASDEIDGHIEDVRASTAEMVTSIGAIDGSIRHVDEIAAAISAAVEEQGVATNEIASSVKQASIGASEMSSTIAGVAGAARHAGDASGEIVSAAALLARQAESLRSQVAGFIAQVRAA